MKPEDILWVKPKQRRRVRPPFRRRKRYNTEPKRRVFSREELIEYLRANNFRSVQQLIRGRKPGEPREYDYRREFDKWQNAKTEAFGMELSAVEDLGFDDESIISSVIECNLWTIDAYLAKRKQMPDIFPSMRQVLKRWGKYSVLKGVARQRSLKGTMDAYRKLWNRLGRTPSMGDVRSAGIELGKAISHFKSKKELDEFMAGWGGDHA
jgi:hypothetical protein